jgi:hypothetical protein
VRFSFVVELDEWERLPEPVQLARFAQFVEALIQADVDWLTLGNRWKTVPLLYQSGVRFRREPDGAPNEWPNIPAVLKAGYAHCIGLASWRIAELRVRLNEPALKRIRVFHEERPGVGRVQEFHLQVARGDGTIEDPSRLLGMP